MGVRNIKKQLAGEEDLLLGNGTEDQERHSGIKTLTKLRVNKIVQSNSDMLLLDISKYLTCTVLDTGRVFNYDSTKSLINNSLTILNGWVLQGDLTLTTTDELIDLTSADDGRLCIVTDILRGGNFIYDSNEVSNDNQGTIFNGWVRQYDENIKLEHFGIVSPEYVLTDNWKWDATIDKSTANLGTIIDPTVGLSVQGTGVGTGCMVRQYTGHININWFNPSADGVTDDSPTIDKALRYIETIGGGALDFEPKTYLVQPNSSTYNKYNIFVVPSNTTVNGNGAILDIKMVGGDPLRVFVNSNSGNVGQASSSLRPDLNTTDKNIHISGFSFIESDGLQLNMLLFEFANLTNSSVTKCKVRALWDTPDERGMGFCQINTACKDIRVEDNDVESRYGVWVRNNYDANGGAAPYTEDYNIENIRVCNNKIHYQGDEWCAIHGQDGLVKYVWVENNEVEAPYKLSEGVGADSHAALTVYDRGPLYVSTGSTTFGAQKIFIRNNKVNYILPNKYFFQGDKNAGGILTEITVSGNVCYNPVYGFARLNSASECVISNNISYHGGVGNLGLVRIDGCANLIISNNQFLNGHCGDTYGLVTIDSTSSNINVVGNIVSMRATTGPETTRDGIVCAGTSCNISNNIIKNVQYQSIRVEGIDTNVLGNTIQGSQQFGYRVEATAVGVLISGNVIDGYITGSLGTGTNIVVTNNISTVTNTSSIYGASNALVFRYNIVNGDRTEYFSGIQDYTGYAVFKNLPTSDPFSVGQVWNNSGVATISAG